MANNPQFPGMQPNRPLVGSLVPPQSALPPMSMQYRPMVPPQHPQAYMSMPPQQYQPIVPGNAGMPLPPPPPQIQFPQQVTQLPPRPGAGGDVMPRSQAIPVPDFHPSRPFMPVPAHPSQSLQISNNYMPGFAGPRIPLASSYNLSLPSAGQPQTNTDSATQYQPISQSTVPSFPVDGQPWLSTGNQSMKPVTPPQQTSEQSATAVNDKVPKPETGEKVPSIWIEHTARNGKKYYYNRMTKVSCWEKPVELMTPVERTDASTDWREYTTPDGRKYYYNKVTKQSKWRIPDELKLARAGLKLESFTGIQAVKDIDSHAPESVSISGVNTSSSNVDVSLFAAQTAVASPISVAPVVTEQPTNSVSSVSPIEVAVVAMDAVESVETATPVVAVLEKDANVTPATTFTTENSSDTLSVQDAVASIAGVSPGNTEEAIIGIQESENSEEKEVPQGPIVYENKLEAKKAFKALLETANVGSDWTWDQAMRAITTDQRYGALKTLGERKQAFNEFVGQKKKKEAEERRARLRKAREDFKKMLEESKELTSSSRWSKTISLFEDDERFHTLERPKDREELFEDHRKELEGKERAKALEENKRHRTEYLEFLKSCDFIKASSQWRKVQDRLEADERCSRLEKIDRLEIFQEYVRDLEKEEEEQRRIRMEEQRKAERKNRDEFRKLMEEHVAAGVLTAKTNWRDYCVKVKDSPAYLAVSSNTSGSTAKELFEDVAEELEKQYLDDKTQIKDAIKTGEVNLTSTWTFEEFKTAILKDISSPAVSDVNLKFVFDELLERAKEKEEKEAKKRKRLADELYEFLLTSKEITSSSRWEDCKWLVEERFVEEESFLREIFDKFILELKERAKERERRRREEKARKDKERKSREKKKDKHRGEREKSDESRKRKDRPKSDESDSDRSDSHGFEDDKRSGRDKDKRNRKRYSSSLDDIEKDRSRDSRRHNDDRKKTKRVESASESQHKRHKRDHRDGDYDEHRDADTGEDGEVR